MNITSAIYLFHDNRVVIKKPFEIIHETNKYYFVCGRRYLKSEIGKPILKSTTSYPYIELVMIDTDEQKLREVLSGWFKDMAFRVWSMCKEDNV